ncbi:MAG: hypothetical protein Unbinned97contig1000_26 [Prokaryotic dsDNA virus sp.]|nr:MAG: hypothetical protein Unbinned97contig1000_26 [Prokaryotic dsDNA virus sp.]
MINEINNYVNHRVKPSPLIIAVLSNDLYSACNLLHNEDLKSICKYVSEKVPLEAKGTLYKVEKWLDGNKIN